MTATEDDSSKVVTLDIVFRNMANEIADATELASNIDNALGDWIGENIGTVVPTAVLQNADVLRQSLDCLGVVTKNLSRLSKQSHGLPCSELTEGVFLEKVRKSITLGSKSAP